MPISQKPFKMFGYNVIFRAVQVKHNLYVLVNFYVGSIGKFQFVQFLIC